MASLKDLSHLIAYILFELTFYEESKMLLSLPLLINTQSSWRLFLKVMS